MLITANRSPIIYDHHCVHCVDVQNTWNKSALVDSLNRRSGWLVAIWICCCVTRMATYMDDFLVQIFRGPRRLADTAPVIDSPPPPRPHPHPAPDVSICIDVSLSWPRWEMMDSWLVVLSRLLCTYVNSSHKVRFEKCCINQPIASQPHATWCHSMDLSIQQIPYAILINEILLFPYNCVFIHSLSDRRWSNASCHATSPESVLCLVTPFSRSCRMVSRLRTGGRLLLPVPDTSCCHKGWSDSYWSPVMPRQMLTWESVYQNCSTYMYKSVLLNITKRTNDTNY